MQIRLKNLSLRYRAAFALALTIFVFFSLASFGLQKAYNDSLENAAESELRVYMLSLLGSIDIDTEGKLQLFDLAIAGFNQPNSGVYAEIWKDDTLQWRSNSLIGQALPKVESSLGEYRLFSGITGKQKNDKNILSLLVDWNEDGKNQQFTVIVANDVESYLERKSSYKKNVLFWLVGLGAILVILQILIFKWLLQPINRVMDELEKIRNGKQAEFVGNYPREVSVLTYSLNVFLEAERRQIQRIKDSLGNLAHSLKTPLAAMRSELSESVLNRAFFEQQVDRISTVVDYQLNRTSTSVRPSYRQAQQCFENIDRLIGVMRRLYQDRIKIDAELQANVMFYGDVDDLTEIVGNILENACKWANSKVIIKLRNKINNKLEIIVIDDGPGVPENKAAEILTRGKRLDVTEEGQGIGLAMVNDLVDSYAGELSFEQATIHHTGFSSGLAVVILI